MEAGEENDLTHTPKEEISGHWGRERPNGPGNPCDLRPTYVQAECDRFQANEGSLQVFHLYPLVGAAQREGTIRSVFTTSHQFMSHAGNIHRIEFQVFCWVFWSRVLIHYALRGRKQSRKISLRCASLVFLRVEDVQTENGRYGQGDIVPSTSLETNAQNFYGTDIHMLKTPH